MIVTQTPISSAAPISPLLSQESNQTLGSRGHLLFVDDDDDYREVIRAELIDHGFRVTDFDDSSGLMEHFAAGHDADAILLDWNLRSTSGIELVSILKRQGIRVPVIMLTGMSGSNYEIQALDGGAVDFVDKSKGVPVLARRISLSMAIAKKSEKPRPAGDGVTYGDVILRPQLSRAYWREHELDLTVTEFNILNKLVSSAGEHVSYRAIYDCVHHCGFIAGSGEDGYRTNVRSSIKRIRNKFREIDPTFAEIQNFPAFGYRWRKLAAAA